MIWQKKARLGIAVFIVLFVAFVAIALRQRRGLPASAGSPRTDPDAVTQTLGPSVLERTNKEGKLLVSIASASQTVYPDGRTVLNDVKLVLPDRGGRRIDVTANHAEKVSAPAQGQQIGVAHLTGAVVVKTSDGIVLNGDEATYSEADAIISVPGRVTFTRGRMTGSGVGATYDQNRDVLWLLDKAEVKVTADKRGAGAMHATCGSAGLARGEHYVRLSRTAHVVSQDRTMDADEITAYLTPDDEHIHTMELRTNSRITGSAASGPQKMAADNIDLTYAADGRTLQNSRLMQNALVELPGERGSAGRKIAATTIDIAMGPDGTTVTNLNATEHAQVDLAAEGDEPSRRIRATALTAIGAPGTGLQSATFVDRVEFSETRAAKRNQPAIDRSARSDRLIMQTKPGLGAIQEADFHGNVHFTDGTDTTAEAPRAVYHVDRDQIDLSPGEGEPGPAPNVNDGKVSVEARNIQMVLGAQKLTADTKVRSWMQAAKKPEPAAGTTGAQAGRAAGPAQPSPSKEASRVPSMLKQDEQVNVTSNRVEYDGSASLATYSGSANLWQGETTIKANTIVLDSKTGNLTARTAVTTVMLFEDLDPKTKQRRPMRTTATADSLVYEDAKRVATYTGDGATKAHIAGPQGDITGDRIDLLLKTDGNELDRMEAAGGVVVVEGERTAKGSHLTYTAANDQYVMIGTPVEVIEITTPPPCKKSIGATLTFMRSVDKITVAGNGVYGQQSMTVDCPAGRS